MRFRKRIFRLVRGTGQTLMDSSKGAWTLEIGNVWLARFGEEWRQKYPTTWAFGHGDNAWWYTPDARTVSTDLN